jgi:WD40 repeat protein
MAYDAFISYSHAADGRLAPALQVGLQRLARPWNHRWALRVFRDDTGLAVNPDLWGSIAGALDDSTYFVLLASPEARASPWVNREIEHFCGKHPAENILPVLTDGSLVWDTARGDYDPGASTALPPALVGRFTDEPRHLDLHWAREQTQLDLRHSRFREAVADLASPIHNMPKDELESEDIRRHRRAQRLVRGGASGLALLFVLSSILGAVAWQQRATARHEALVASRSATSARAEALAAQAINAAHDHRDDLALLLGIESNRLHPSPLSRGALLTALADQPGLQRELHGLNDTTEYLAFSTDGRILAGVSNRTMLWSVQTGQPLSHQPTDTAGITDSAVFADHARFLVRTSYSVTSGGDSEADVWDIDAGQHVRTIPLGHTEPGLIGVADSAPLAAAADEAGTVRILDLRTGDVVHELSGPSQYLAWSGERLPSEFALSADGSRLSSSSFALIGSPSAPTGSRGFTATEETRSVVTGQVVGHGCQTTGSLASRSQPLGQATPASREPASFSPDGQSVRTAWDPSNGDRIVIHCDVASGRATATTLSLKPSSEGVIGESPDDRMIVGRGVDDGNVQLFDTATHARIGGPLPDALVGMRQEQVAFSPDSRLYTATESDGTVRIWSTTSAPPFARLSSIAGRGYQAPPLAVADSGDVALAQRWGGQIDVLDLANDRVLATLPPGGQDALSSDGDLASTVTSDRLVLFDVRRRATTSVPIAAHACGGSLGNGSVAVTSKPLTLAIVCATNDPNGVAGSVQLVHVSGSGVRLDPVKAVDFWPNELLFSPNGRVLVASKGTGDFEAFDVGSGGLHSRWRTSFPTGTGFAYTPDSRMLVETGDHPRLWPLDRATGPVDLIGVPTGQVAAVSGGELLATDSPNGDAVSLWDLASGSFLATVSGGQGSTVGLAFSRDRRALTQVTASGSPPDSTSIPPTLTTVARWDLDPKSWERDACLIANRNLTSSEWTRYVGDLSYQRVCPDLP